MRAMLFATASSLGASDRALGQASEEMTQAAAGAGHARGPRAVSAVLEAVLEQLDDELVVEAGIEFGWRSLDLDVAPMTAGQLILFAARPAVGKSIALRNVARRAAVDQGKGVLHCTAEMTEGGCPLRSRRAGRGPGKEAAAARHPVGIAVGPGRPRNARLGEVDLLIADDEQLDLPTLRGLIRRHRPDLVVVDYVQLMTPPDTGKNGSRREALEALTRGLKITAKTERVPIVLAAQLNRGSETRADKRPAMSDLRETGALEQDADVMMLLHPPDLHEKETVRAGEVEVIVAKQRNGPTPTVHLAAQLPFSRFVDLGTY